MKLSDYAKKVGVRYETAWRWFQAGTIRGHQLPTGTISITEDEPTASTTSRVAMYARVSAAEHQPNLNAQADRLVGYCAAKGYQAHMVVKEVGSGVNDSRPKFLKLLSDTSITHIVVEHQDRATRVGFRSIETLLAQQGRILSFALPASKVSIWTLDDRQPIPFVCGERQRSMLETRQGESDLRFHRGAWYLLVTCEVEEPDPQDVDAVLGVDLGVVNLAMDSDGDVHSGKDVERKRQWYANRRKALQSVGTKSATRRLKQWSGRQRRFQKDGNHQIRKQLVAKAERTKRAIGVEDLTHIRTRARVSGPVQRARHRNWAFRQLRAFIAYKAQRAGVMLVAIDPAYTRQRCTVCGHTERANRRSQAAFCGVVCGHASPADYNAACNIRDRADVRRPMVSNLRVEAQAREL